MSILLLTLAEAPNHFEVEVGNQGPPTDVFEGRSSVAVLNDALRTPRLVERLGALVVVDIRRLIEGPGLVANLRAELAACPDSKGRDLADRMLAEIDTGTRLLAGFAEEHDRLTAEIAALKASTKGAPATVREEAAARPDSIVIVPSGPTTFDVWGPHTGVIAGTEGNNIETVVRSVVENLYQLADLPTPSEIRERVAEMGMRGADPLADLLRDGGIVVIHSEDQGETPSEKHRIFDVAGPSERVSRGSAEDVVRSVRTNLQAITGRNISE